MSLVLLQIGAVFTRLLLDEEQPAVVSTRRHHRFSTVYVKRQTATNN